MISMTSANVLILALYWQVVCFFLMFTSSDSTQNIFCISDSIGSQTNCCINCNTSLSTGPSDAVIRILNTFCNLTGAIICSGDPFPWGMDILTGGGLLPIPCSQCNRVCDTPFLSLLKCIPSALMGIICSCSCHDRLMDCLNTPDVGTITSTETITTATVRATPTVKTSTTFSSTLNNETLTTQLFPKSGSMTNASLSGNDSSPSTPMSGASENSPQNLNGLGIGLGVGIGGILLIVLIILVIFCIKKRKRSEPTKSTAVNNAYMTEQDLNSATNSTTVFDKPVGIPGIGDGTYYNDNNPQSAQPANDNTNYEDVDANQAQNLTRGKYGRATTMFPNTSHSGFTITDNDMYQSTPGGNIALEENSSYSLETFSNDSILAKKTGDIGHEGFTIVENDFYH